MHSLADWSVGIGRWRGVPVRIHLLFVVLALVTFYLASGEGSGGDRDLVWVAACGLGVLVVAVLIHELGHVVAARRLGGQLDEIVLGPLGGLVQARIPPHLQHEWVVAAAGPLANLLLAALLTVPLMLAGQMQLGLLNPIAPSNFAVQGLGLLVVKLGVWINWLLFLINLLPVFPFDAGPALRAILKPTVGSRSAVVYTSRLGMLLGCALLLAAWLLHDYYQHADIPTWPALTLLGVFLLFSARRDAARLGKDISGDTLGTDADADLLDASAFEEIDDEEAVLVRQPQRRQEREDSGHTVDTLEEERLDDVLARLHQSSLEELSPEDRRLLLEASRRYRRRRQQRNAN